jgi:arylsulfatase A
MPKNKAGTPETNSHTDPPKTTVKHKIHFLSLFACSLLSVPPLSAADAKPNIVIFLADDMGWGDAGCFGHPTIKTPTLDRLASQGVRLTNCHSGDSVCSPSRAAMLTGRTPYRNGVFRWIPEKSEIHLRTSEVTIPTVVKNLGYATCHTGKWHLNGEFNSPEQPQPDAFGYDWWFATQNNAKPSHKNPSNFVRNGKAVGPLEGYSALLVADEAIDWLRNHRDKKKPFFMTVWTHEPHMPIESAPRFQALYKDIENPGKRQYYGDVTQMDAGLGMVLDELEKQGLADNTLFIFTSDNGPEGSGKGNVNKPNSQQNRTWGSTHGLRGRKRYTYEGGIRVPGVIRWPGHIKPGSVSDEPVFGCDYFPTVCEILGVPLPKDRTIDGASILPVFAGKPVRRATPIFWHNNHFEMRLAITEGDWKLVGNAEHTKFELYNLKDDIAETTDVSSKFPERFESMKMHMIAQDKEVLAEGPSEWWQRDAVKKKNKKKMPKKKNRGR